LKQPKKKKKRNPTKDLPQRAAQKKVKSWAKKKTLKNKKKCERQKIRPTKKKPPEKNNKKVKMGNKDIISEIKNTIEY